ncbi:hypothetical protein [Bacteroides sp. 224]|uniref:hypothetical protein n=1 Tax=Bacteroides sp. 224 TaxID=2302936 RepID=UPI0013D4BA1A|nr:hypothetical protein [Bacteroides sp. 224]NDV63974.1 hypothetical protein [Bacteroides sp. 224]
MDVKNLKKSSKLLRRIENIDSEITEIEKVALVISSGKFESSFELKINDLLNEEVNQKSILDEDGSLKTGSISFEIQNPLAILYGWPTNKTKNKVEKQFDYILKPSLSEASILRILGILLTELMEERNRLLEKLKKNGVTI